MKGRITELQASGFSRKLRSKQLRRRRNHLSPILYDLTKQTVRSNSIPLAFSPNSGCCDEVSCNSTRDSVIQAENEEFRRVTRSYRKLREEETAKWIKGVEMEVSEGSCVESCSVIEAESKLQSKAAEVTDSSVQIAVCSVEDCDRIFKSNARKLTENVAISETFGEDCEVQLSDITGSCSNVNLSILNPASTIGKNTRSMRVDLDLACPEHLSDDDEDVQDVSSTTFSELQSEILVSNSELDFSEEYTPSFWLGTGSQFSENSIGDSTPSYSFSLFKQYKQELSMISSRRDKEASWRVEDEYSDEVTFWRFEDEEDEESYRRLRSRERKKALKLNDYAVEADSKTEYGTLIIEQRLLMVNWIVEVSRFLFMISHWESSH
ncbi:hypothetical protein Nepgr_028116 [Nepenthes gracilis]|uniref:Uncharacterized protein n=1 Tax=Nepenthes gracilis TaxID=150966 RepID=A0AAD3TBR3_NEPGR|nr:hypothetical protein Nepgr_028116 [Nepenthes gracilis]